MPATPDELVTAAIDRRTPARWQDGSEPTESERGDILALTRYIDRMVADRVAGRGEPQRRAMGLLRSLLSPDQRRQLRQQKCFRATAASGNIYRFFPRSGHCELVTRHGRHHFRRIGYCVHDDRDDPDAMPPADLTVAHLLMILADEPGFLATANARDLRDQLWNGEYLRRMRRRHRA